MTDSSPLAASDQLLAHALPSDLDDAYENSAYIPGATAWLQGLPAAQPRSEPASWMHC